MHCVAAAELKHPFQTGQTTVVTVLCSARTRRGVGGGEVRKSGTEAGMTQSDPLLTAFDLGEMFA